MNRIQAGDMLRGPFWPEKVKVLSVTPIGERQLKIECVGLDRKERKFYEPVLSEEDLRLVKIIEEQPFQFTGDGEPLFLYLESHRIRNAFQFDPLYAVNVSQIDPLPHQIEAVYHYILQNDNPKIRFMLADDPGAGKTIMAGLLLKELKYRGLVDRTLIVVPGQLKVQWHREMKERFQENFEVVDRGVLDSAWGQNVFTEKNQIIVSLDFVKQKDVMDALKDSNWDLSIVDEAHKMSAYIYGEKKKEKKETQRYGVGKEISAISNYLLFLTATPHRGDPENFRLLLDLLKPGFFATTEMLSESIEDHDNPLFLRRLKEDLTDFDKAPLFPPRKVETTKYHLSEDEKVLYNAVTEYVQKHFNRALAKDKRNVAFALMVLQRRLASSVRAIKKSLERREKRLKELYKMGKLVQDLDYDMEEGFLDDLEETERWKKEEELLERLSSAETLPELASEIEKLEELVAIAKDVEKKEVETKLNELKRVIDLEHLQRSEIKLLIFTESKDTLEYLVEKLKKWEYSVTFIHGGLNLNKRIAAESAFWNEAQIMVCTEAGGEGINLQCCWLMVNYDIPWNPNRLEQRMGRIHRYGQQHEVHIYNLVAVDTREGRILEKLFDKLEQIRSQLGSDRVFDVVGDVLVGTNLRDLIVDAIANKRTMEDILKYFDRTPDEVAIAKVKEASLVALATRHIDLPRILGELRVAKENRLVPEYVEEFFKRASALLDIKIEKRHDGFWRVNLVPSEIRNRSYEFKTKYGKVENEYNKISFNKNLAAGQAVFVAMGHPLLESVIDTIMQRYSSTASEGATFSDPDRKLDGIVWLFEGEIRDGKDTVAGKRLFAVYQDFSAEKQPLSFISPALLWDLKPIDGLAKKQGAELLDTAVELAQVKSYVISQGLEEYKFELLKRRQRDAEIKTKYGIRSLDSMILESEGKLADYATRKMKGEPIPEPNIQRETKKEEDSKRKRKRLLQEIEAETHLYPTDPELISAVRVVSEIEVGGPVHDPKIEQIGMNVAMAYEKDHSRQPEDVHLDNRGYDVISKDATGNYRYIEVKARAAHGDIIMTPNEWLMAQRLNEEYWLYIVTSAASTPQLHLIRDPFASLEPDMIVDVVRYVFKEWQDKAEAP